MNIRKFYEAYEKLTDKIELLWENLTSPSKVYFDGWETYGEDVLVHHRYYYNHDRGQVIIPKKCFEVETLEEAKEIFKNESK